MQRFDLLDEFTSLYAANAMAHPAPEPTTAPRIQGRRWLAPLLIALTGAMLIGI